MRARVSQASPSLLPMPEDGSAGRSGCNDKLYVNGMDRTNGNLGARAPQLLS